MSDDDEFLTDEEREEIDDSFPVSDWANENFVENKEVPAIEIDENAEIPITEINLDAISEKTAYFYDSKAKKEKEDIVMEEVSPVLNEVPAIRDMNVVEKDISLIEAPTTSITATEQSNEAEKENYEKICDDFCTENKISIDKEGFEKVKSLGDKYFRLLYARLLEFQQSAKQDAGLRIGDKGVYIYVEKDKIIQDTPQIKRLYDEADETKRVQDIENFKAKILISPQREINTALDFFDNKVFLAIPFDVEYEYTDKRTNEKIKDRMKLPVVITSERKKYEIRSRYCKELNLYFSHIPTSFKNRWDTRSVLDFLDRKEQDVSFKEVFFEIRELMKKYIDFDDNRYYSLITIWIIGTYFHRIFNVYPYLYFGGTKQVGKSKMLDFIDCLAFNSVNSLSNTTANMYRMMQDFSPTLLIDEEFKVAKKEVGDYHAILLAGYKKGKKVNRSRELPDKKYITDEFETYCPKAFANIEGIEEVLENRTISIIMLRTENRSIANSEINSDDAIWQKLRDKLYLLLMKFGRGSSRITPKNDGYDVFDSSIRNEGVDVKNDGISYKIPLLPLLPLPIIPHTTIQTSTSSTTSTKTLKTFNKIEFSARLNELFSSLLNLATLLELENLGNTSTKFEKSSTTLLQENIYDEIYSLARDIAKEKQSEEIETVDFNLLSWFLENIVENKFYSTIEITKKIKTDENIDEGFRNDFNAMTLGWFLRRYKLITTKKRIHGKTEVLLNPEKIRIIAKKFAVEKQKSEKQDNIDETSESIDENAENKHQESINDDKNILSLYNNQRIDNQNIDDNSYISKIK